MFGWCFSQKMAEGQQLFCAMMIIQSTQRKLYTTIKKTRCHFWNPQLKISPDMYKTSSGTKLSRDMYIAAVALWFPLICPQKVMLHNMYVCVLMIDAPLISSTTEKFNRCHS